MEYVKEVALLSEHSLHSRSKVEAFEEPLELAVVDVLTAYLPAQSEHQSEEFLESEEKHSVISPEAH